MDGTDRRTDSGDTICSTPHPHPSHPTENGRGITMGIPIEYWYVKLDLMQKLDIYCYPSDNKQGMNL